MRLIDADRLLSEKMKSKYYHLPNGDIAIPLIDIEHAPTIEPEPKWISVTERLPEDDTVVLVCGKGGGVYTAIHNNTKTWIRGWWKMNSKNHHCNPTAWMPLPEPYKEEDNERA